MSTTVWGAAARLDEIVAHYDARGRFASAHRVKAFHLELPADPIRVTLRHSTEIGDLAHMELDEQGRLLAVAVLDDGSDDLIADAGDLYFSPDYTAYGRNLRSDCFTVELAEITGLAVTPTPAGFAAKASPLKALRGDLRDHLDRYSAWPSSWRSNKLLARAVEARSHSRAPTHIGAAPVATYYGRDAGATYPPAYIDPIEHWPAPGDGSTILSVR